MSWSVSASGKPQEVKANLATQFENAKAATAYFPLEQETVEALEAEIGDQLDSIDGAWNVIVSASGSAYKGDTSAGFGATYGLNATAPVQTDQTAQTQAS